MPSPLSPSLQKHSSQAYHLAVGLRCRGKKESEVPACAIKVNELQDLESLRIPGLLCSIYWQDQSRG